MGIFASIKSKFNRANKTRRSFWGVKFKNCEAADYSPIYLPAECESASKEKTKMTLKRKLVVISSSLFAAGAIVGGAYMYLSFGVDWQMLEDERIGRNYIPSNEIASIAASLRLTRKGKAVFYATAPELQKNTVFNAFCGRDGYKDAYTLGCYYKDDTEHILIFNQGMGQFDENGLKYNFADGRKMTALHEMLHAAYDRLDEKQKNETCEKLKIVTNRIKELGDEMALYPENQICTESFARLGSEYIPRFNAVSANISLSGYSLNDEEKKAVSELTSLYGRYYDVKNPDLIDSFWRNKNNLTDYLKKIADCSDELEKQYYIAQDAVNNYFNNPTKGNLEKAKNEVSLYSQMYDEVNNMVISYQKIFVIEDSEKLLIGDGYIVI